MPLRYPASARRYYAASALLAQRAGREARRARNRGLAAIAAVVATHQAAEAVLAQAAVGTMLAEQDIESTAEAMLNSAAFTTSAAAFEAMIDQATTDYQFDLIVSSLTQDAARSAQQVAMTARPRIKYVRMLTPPSCSRCAVLAGTEWSSSKPFLRHPGCDCVMIPTTVANDLLADPFELAQEGQVTGLSKADMRAIADGADFSKVVNVRRRAAGLSEAGEVLKRGDRMTPAGIYRAAGDDRKRALALLQKHGYIR